MEDNSNVPVTVLGSRQEPGGILAIGDKYYYPPNSQADSYWLVVLDLHTLEVVANDVYTGNDEVPDSLKPYVDDARYLLVLTSMGLRTDHVPQKKFYDLLKSAGAGALLDRAEQISKQLGTAPIGFVSYILAATMNPADAKGFEEFSFTDRTIMTFALMPITINGQTTYTPIKTGS